MDNIISKSSPTAPRLTGSVDSLPDGFVEALQQSAGLSDECSPKSAPTIQQVHSDKEFETVGLQFDGCLDAADVQDWIDEVLELYGNNLLRIKGILNLKGYEKPAVLQCVRDTVHPIELLDAPAEPVTSNNIVAIGWDMHRELLTEALSWLADRAEL